MPDLTKVYGICGHLSSENYRKIVRERIDWIRRLRDNWNKPDIVTDAMVAKFKALFGIQGCSVGVAGSVFAKDVLNTYLPVFNIVPATPTDDGLVVQMDIENVDNDSWVSVPYG